MGNIQFKRTFAFLPRNCMKDNYTCSSQKDITPKPDLCDLSLDTETSHHSAIQETHSSDEDAEEVFYQFVILHAEDDVEEAVRIQELLQNEFSIKPGIIFAEMPSGRHLVENLKDAINGSAWTVILLTENFLSDLWCEFQLHISLIHTFTKPHKNNTVIPLRPRNNPLPWERTPFAFKSINALQEDNPGFTEQVKRTFQKSIYSQQQALWRNEKKKSVVQELLE